jgi:hypothetical protein
MTKKRLRQSCKAEAAVGSGGSSGTTGATRQPAGKQEVNGRGGVQKTNGRGGVSGQEVTVRREDESVLGACWGTEELGWNERSRKKLRDVR